MTVVITRQNSLDNSSPCHLARNENGKWVVDLPNGTLADIRAIEKAVSGRVLVSLTENFTIKELVVTN